MANIGRILHFDIDLSLPLKQVHAAPMIEGDRLADVIEIALNNHGEAVDPSGLTAAANAELAGQDGVTVRNPGTVAGGKITIPLVAECYAVPGSIRISVTLTSGTTTRTVLLLTGYVEQNGTGIIIDPSGSIPSYDDLAQIVSQLEAAKQAANTATAAANSAASNASAQASDANTAAQTANTAASNANSKASAANTAAQAANTAASTANTAAAKIDGLTVSATSLAAELDPTAAVSETGGHKHITFGIPKGRQGDKGNTGATPKISIGTVTTGTPGSQATATITGTAENPVFNFAIPEGRPGSGIGTVTSVNGVDPDAGGNVTLAASDVGALPSGGTAADAAMLGGKEPAYYVQPHNLLDNSRFEIAQEGYGGLHGTQAYACDRWKLVSGSVSHSDAGMSLNGTISQEISEAPSVPVTPAVSAGTITYDAGTNTVTITTTKATVIKWAALYEGTYTTDTLPPYHPKGYMAELLACQRYYYPYKPSNTALSFAGWHYSTSAVRVALPLPVAMDISSSRVPTISLDTANVLVLPEKNVPTSIQVTVLSPNMIFLTLSVDGTQHDLCAVRINAPLVIIAPD